jgi:hypothetical protein
MSKFDAALAVEPMVYDFTKYGGTEGTIPEPSTGQMNDFMVGMRRLITEYRSMATASTDKSPEDMDPDELAAFMDSMDETMEIATEFNDKTVLLTADFCSNQPGQDDLSKLPLRVMRAFSKWLMAEINPKDATEEDGPQPPTPIHRQPQDHQSRRGTNGSRKGGQ